MKQSEVRFKAGESMLEAVWYHPGGNAPFPAVVLCHPHSLYGGSMHNIVIVKIAQAQAVRSIATLAFNFRGAGRSGGRFAEGIGEQDDVLAALEWLRQQAEVDKERVGLAGYSFGGGVALEAACRTDAVNALALLAPWTGKPAGGWENCRAATYILGGSVDDVVTTDNLKLIFRHLPEPKKLEIIDGADHFMADFSGAAAEKIAAFFEETLKG